MRIGIGVLLLICMSVSPVWAEPEEIEKKGCRDCHRFSSEEKQPARGPDLFYAGDKFHENWLKEFLQSPKVIRKVGYITDPGFPSGNPEVSQPHSTLTHEESARVSTFLMTLHLPDYETGKVDDVPLSKGARAQAKMLFERNFGCIACHEALNLVGKVRGGVSGPTLVDSGLRLKPDWVFHWLKSPEKFLPRGRMPVFNLDDETAIRITKYVLSIRTKK